MTDDLETRAADLAASAADLPLADLLRAASATLADPDATPAARIALAAVLASWAHELQARADANALAEMQSPSTARN